MLLFGKLPEGFPTLANFAAPGITSLPRAPDPGLAERLRKIFDREMSRGYRGVLKNQFRKIPYAYFVEGRLPLSEDHPVLVDRYWTTILPEAIRSSARRRRRWLGPLLRCYVDSFNAGSLEFRSFAKTLRELLKGTASDGALIDEIRKLDEVARFLDPEVVGDAIADRARSRLRSQSTPFDPLLEQLGFVDTQLGNAVLRSFISVSADRLRDREIVLGALQWAGRLAAPISTSENSAYFADAMLLPWREKSVSDEIRRALLDFFLSQYGDPRTGGNRYGIWMGVSDAALAVILRWLAGDTLRAFIKILQKTADEIWEYREKFWMAYYDAGYVDEVWLALGRDARMQARDVPQAQGERRYGSLDGSGVQREHSVLLIKIGGLIFSEWSHNGSLRALSEDDPRAPRLYQAQYDGGDIRDAGSLDFHDGRLARRSLSHHGSPRGGWQRQARDFIFNQTGIHLSDSKIL